MVARLTLELSQAISPARLESYRRPDETDFQMVTNYFWNLELYAALLPSMHGAELCLRNTLDATIRAQLQTREWFEHPNFLQPGQYDEYMAACRRVGRNQTLTSDRIVAELHFGFWTALLSSRYQWFWGQSRYAPYRAAFPFVGNERIQTVRSRFFFIKDLRNRVAHHEPIWNRPQLASEYRSIHEAICWINPTMSQAILAVDRFRDVSDPVIGRLAVEQNLRNRFASPD